MARLKGSNHMRKTISMVLSGFLSLVAASSTARSEEQLPINELDACEIVLHELIADLMRAQRDSRRESRNSRDADPGLYIARHQATEEAFAQAIMLARAKYGRCPWYSAAPVATDYEGP
jgi:hypothetical protein